MWPDRPRILFVAGDPDNVPYAEHRQALLQAIQSFQYPGRDDLAQSKGRNREQFGEMLTILNNPTLTDVFRECRKNHYTHVHILTHGDLSETSPDSYGLILRGQDDAPDVVSGDQFASALTAVSSGGIHRPTVVTVANCDSGNVGTVIIPGASFAHALHHAGVPTRYTTLACPRATPRWRAHALHHAGVPLVVASQFPLSKEGSVPLAGALYTGLLWGENPLVLLQQLRAELHVRYTSSWHDWASLVVYRGAPSGAVRTIGRLAVFPGQAGDQRGTRTNRYRGARNFQRPKIRVTGRAGRSDRARRPATPDKRTVRSGVRGYPCQLA